LTPIEIAPLFLDYSGSAVTLLACLSTSRCAPECRPVTEMFTCQLSLPIEPADPTSSQPGQVAGVEFRAEAERLNYRREPDLGKGLSWD
jgi:hypothetical protein